MTDLKIVFTFQFDKNITLYHMALTSRENEIMIETNKGLYFAKIYIED
jgi:hypothetical protein